jgi:hypothetical protein
MHLFFVFFLLFERYFSVLKVIICIQLHICDLNLFDLSWINLPLLLLSYLSNVLKVMMMVMVMVMTASVSV